MRKYRAVVIDGKKVIRRMTAVTILGVVLLASVFNLKISDFKVSVDGKRLAEKVVLETLPQTAGTAVTGALFEELGMAVRKAASFVLGFDPCDPRSVASGHIPLVHTVSQGYLASVANGETSEVFNPVDADKGKGKAEPDVPKGEMHPICEVDSSQEKTLGKSQNKILIRNETNFAINTEDLLNAPLKFDLKGEGPKVLIVHTHATECYSPEGASTYSADKSDRTLDTSQNMIAVGEAVREAFERKGISVVHDKTIHDHPSFNGSYANSLKTVESYKAKYPSIEIVLDLHRDAFVYEDGSKAKFVTEVDGKKTAQLMLVVGTNGGGLDHPNWRENMKFALKLQNKITEKYPRLMRGVNLRKERFNGHTTYGSIIIEVGSSGNTLSEAIRGATIGAEEIADFLKDLD